MRVLSSSVWHGKQREGDSLLDIIITQRVSMSMLLHGRVLIGDEVRHGLEAQQTSIVIGRRRCKTWNERNLLWQGRRKSQTRLVQSPSNGPDS